MPKGKYQRLVKTILTNDGVFQFLTKVTHRGEGTRESYHFDVPSSVIRGLFHVGWDRTWLEIRIEGVEPYFACGRVNPNGHGIVTIPKRVRTEQIKHDVIISVDLRDARHRRIKATDIITPSGIDWAATVPLDQFVVEAPDGCIDVQHRIEGPFRMKRYGVEPSTFWLLGLYQAEGSKSQTAMDWSFALKSPALIKQASDCLQAMSISVERQYLEVLHSAEQNPEETREKFESIGVAITSVRIRPGKGYECGVFHTRNSKTFMRMTVKVLEAMPRHLEMLTKEQLKQYALGFLAGDASITISKNFVELRLSGKKEEQEVARECLEMVFGWERKGSAFKSESYGIYITLKAKEMMELAINGAFVNTSSRARLLLGLEARSENIRRLYKNYNMSWFTYGDAVYAEVSSGALNIMAKWGVVIKEGDAFRLTPSAQYVCETFPQLKKEIAELNTRFSPGSLGRTGIKGKMI